MANMLADLWNGNDDAADERREREAEEELRQRRIQAAREAAERARAGFGGGGASAFHSWAQNAMAPGMQAHSNALGAVNAAIGGEMQSRVAQAREIRRMEHEREMERMRQETLLKRLQAEQEMAKRPSRDDGYRQVAPNAFIRHG